MTRSELQSAHGGPRHADNKPISQSLAPLAIIKSTSSLLPAIHPSNTQKTRK